MLSQHKVKEILFGNYTALIAFTKSKFNAESKGIPCEELVNEAIISVLDIKNIDSVETLLSFVKKSIENIYYHEKSLLKNSNFSTKVSSDGEEFNISEINKPPVFINAPSEEFAKIYSLFERWRYKKYDGHIKCHRCGSTSVYYINSFDGRRAFAKCKVCNIPISITARTYIHKQVISYQQFYKAVSVVIKDPKIFATRLGKRIKTTRITAQKKKNLILSAIETTGQNKRYIVLEKILTAIPQDETPIKMINFTNRIKEEDVINCRRLYNDKIYKIKELAEMFNTDRSNMRKIVKGLTWLHLPMPKTALTNHPLSGRPLGR